MKKRYKIILVLIGLVIGYQISNNFITSSMAIGRYSLVVPDNYQSHLAETPSSSDVLELYEDGTFNSNYFGNGTYQISPSLFDSHINLKYDNGTAGYEATVERKLFSALRIILDEDFGLYYKKEN